MSKLFILLPLLLITIADARLWKNKANKSFEADYVSNDGKQVTLSKKGRIITFAIDKLHPENQAWLKKNHPFDPAALKGKEEAPPEGAAFDTLEFGDSQEDVIRKLKTSKLVEGEVVEALLARTGMNGIYRTKGDIGGLRCRLYFEWTSGKNLREISFQTDPLAEETYGEALHDNWLEWIKVLSMFHGKPVQDGDYPDINDLEDGLTLGSHIWYTKDGHSVILGTGQNGSRYSVVVRITSERISPNRF